MTVQADKTSVFSVFLSNLPSHGRVFLLPLAFITLDRDFGVLYNIIVNDIKISTFIAAETLLYVSVSYEYPEIYVV